MTSKLEHDRKTLRLEHAWHFDFSSNICVMMRISKKHSALPPRNPNTWEWQRRFKCLSASLHAFLTQKKSHSTRKGLVIDPHVKRHFLSDAHAILAEDLFKFPLQHRSANFLGEFETWTRTKSEWWVHPFWPVFGLRWDKLMLLCFTY